MARVRVHELAKELGVPSRLILDWLKQHGEFVKSAASTIQPGLVARLRREFPAGSISKGSRSLTSAEDALRRDAAAMLDVDEDSLRLRHPRPVPGRRRVPTSPLDGWAMNLMDAADKATWMAAGLGPDDARVAQQCVDAGLTPNDLPLRLDGVRAAVRLRGGESVASVKIRIQEHRQRSESA